MCPRRRAKLVENFETIFFIKNNCMNILLNNLNLTAVPGTIKEELYQSVIFIRTEKVRLTHSIAKVTLH